jgi:hypothetical protein
MGLRGFVVAFRRSYDGTFIEAIKLGLLALALERYEQIVGQVVTIGQQRAALAAKRDKGQLSAVEVEQPAGSTAIWRRPTGCC